MVVIRCARCHVICDHFIITVPAHQLIQNVQLPSYDSVSNYVSLARHSLVAQIMPITRDASAI